MSYQFTVFTPTYNRINTIKDVYECLLRQTFSDFEWIVVDDGSSDGTSDWIQSIKNQAFFPIKLIVFQNNTGKHVAQNRALDIAEGELFLPLDSDDTMVDNALDVFQKAWNGIPSSERSSYSGIGCHCMDKQGNLIGTKWPNGQIISNDLEILLKYHVKGEKWGPVRTDIVKQFRTKEAKGHFYPENAIWFKIAQRYKKLYIDKKLRYYIIREDSVQKIKGFVDIENAECKMEGAIVHINEFFDWYLKYDIKKGIRKLLIGVKGCVECCHPLLFGKDSFFNTIKPKLAKVIIIFASPYYLLFHLFLKKRGL